MGRLDEIAAEHQAHTDRYQKRVDAERAERRRRREKKAKQEAMIWAKAFLDRVIFPARWTVDRVEGDEVTVIAVFEGKLLLAYTWHDHGESYGRGAVKPVGGGRSDWYQSPTREALGRKLIHWGLI